MIKNNLAKILGERQIKITELARMTGLNYIGLWKFYKGKTKMIEFATMEKICKSLRITVGELFEYIEE